MNKNIIDVSRHQEKIDWKTAAPYVELAILRVQDGVNTNDEQYLNNVAGCEQNNIPYGCYEFFRATTLESAEKEMDIFLQRSRENGANPLFYVIDVEINYTSSEVVSHALKYLKNKGILKVGLYLAHHYHEKYKDSRQYANFIWIPRYGVNPPIYPCDLWQYSESGKIPGINTNKVDLNKLNGNKKLEYFTDASSSPIPPVGQPMPDFPLPSGWVFAKGGYQSYNGITDSWGPYIEYIQEALNLVADGRFGEATHQAVLNFQAQRGLSQDGKVGRNTWNALREKRDGASGSGGSSSGYDDGSTYTGAFKLQSGHCYGKLGIAYASHNGYEDKSDRPAIRGIQKKLGLSQDGLFGSDTHNAVVAFQTKYGLTKDGKVGTSTWRSIIFNTDGGQVYGSDSFPLQRGHCYGKLGIKYASHNGYENSSDRPAIRKIQQRLGLYSDGLFGSGTHSAVVAFQRSRGLTADGKVGPGTWNKMF